jgi:hypothetical protein
MLIRESYRYHRANRNEQLIIRYQQYIRRVGQRNRQIRRQFNYRMQLDWLEEHGYLTFDEGEKREWVRILEQAGFSHTLISEEEEQMILNRLKKINKND